MNVHENILSAIGRTPLVRLTKLVGPQDAAVYVKCEFMNPGMSVKDRMALFILDKAEREGKLKPGGTIVENTSGNTGMGVALWAAVKGYRCVFTMPDKMSLEKVNRLKALGAVVVVTPTNVPAESPQSYYEVAKRIARETPGSFALNQYHNPDNIEAHYRSTGPEIWEQMDGKIDCFVAGLGTGGTMSGAGRFFKEKREQVRNIGADPIGSVYHSYFKTKQLSTPHVYKVEGIGEDMLCAAMNFAVLDDVRQVDDRQSFVAARRLAREEGIFGGGSSGAAVHVAMEVARELGAGKNIVCMLPDSGAMYVSKFYSDEWMRDNGFIEDRSLGKVADLLGSRSSRVVSARRGERAEEVIQLMRQNGFSQLPVVDAKGKGEGMVHEVDLLSAMLGGRLRAHDAIDPIIQPLQGVVTPQTPVDKLRELLLQDNVAVVSDAERVIAIVNKIDLIEYLAARAT